MDIATSAAESSSRDPLEQVWAFSESEFLSRSRRYAPQIFRLSEVKNRLIFEVMLHVALIEPEIPPNTGNIARLCAATFTRLHIVGVPGFRLDEKAVKRAGLDYWDDVDLRRHRNIDTLYENLPEVRFLYFTTKAEKVYTEWKFEENDCLVFGRETRGLPEDLLRANWERCLTIPMPNKKVRSLNLSNSVAIVLYEALRQIGFE